MGLFQKKFDIEKDNLRIEFNIDMTKYDVYYGSEMIPYNNLSRNSKRIIDNKNKILLENRDVLFKEIEKVKVKRRFDKLKSMGYRCDSFEYLGIPNGTMSREVEDKLNSLVNEEDVLLGIHRIGCNNSLDKIEEILVNGLEMTGHLGGVIKNDIELKHNVSYYPNNKTIIKELMYADKYKNSKGSILIRIPDEDLMGNIFVTSSDGRTFLNPKYIVGYVPLEDNHHLEKIVTLEQLKKNNNEYSYNYNGDDRLMDYGVVDNQNKMRR